MTLTSAELYIIDTLDGTKEDLQILDLVYSDLVRDLNLDTSELVKGKDLGLIADTLYRSVAEAIATELECYIGYTVVKNSDGSYTDFNISEHISEQLGDIANDIRETEPNITDLTNVKFGNILDEVLDWECTKSTNIDTIIQYFYDNNELDIREEDKIV